MYPRFFECFFIVLSTSIPLLCLWICIKKDYFRQKYEKKTENRILIWQFSVTVMTLIHSVNYLYASSAWLPNTWHKGQIHLWAKHVLEASLCKYVSSGIGTIPCSSHVQAPIPENTYWHYKFYIKKIPVRILRLCGSGLLQCFHTFDGQVDQTGRWGLSITDGLDTRPLQPHHMNPDSWITVFLWLLELGPVS